jgi:DNA-binding MarR family transcriptional regulator
VGSEEAKARAFIELLADGQDGLWAATERSRLNREPRWFGSPADLAGTLSGEGWGVLDYFVPSPFQCRQREFAALVDRVQVVRVDLDPPAEAPFEEQQAFVEEHFEEVRLLMGDPTAVVDSGRGRWVYLRLSEPISKEQARRLNQALHAFAKSDDRQAYNPAQWARLPGSINEKTGHTAVVSELDPTRLFDPEELEFGLGEFLPKTKQKAIAGIGYDFHWSGEELGSTVLPAQPSLSTELQDYIDSSPTTEESLARWGRVRHQMEMRVFIALVRSGYTNLEVHAFAYQHGLSRYREEFEKKSPYGDLSISKARRWVDDHPLPEKKLPPTLPLTNRRELSPPPREETAEPQRRLKHLRWDLLKEVDGARPGDIYRRTAEKLAGEQGVSERNLQRQMRRLEEDGYVIRKEGEDGTDRLFRSEKGDKAVEARFLPVALMTYQASAEGLEGRKRAIETRRERERLMQLPPRPGRRDSVRARQKRIARNRYHTDFDGRLRLSFDGRQRIFYLQLITPSDEIEVVDLYRRIWVGFDEHGIPEYASAISFSDPMYEGKELDDPARDRGLEPWAAGIGVGAFVTKAGDDFTLALVPNRDGELVPAVGLLVEDVNDFWLALWRAIPDPEGRILRVSRSGKWDDRSFSFEDVGEAIPLDGVPVPDLDKYLDEIASAERLRALVAAQPEHSNLRNYPG